MKNFQIIFYSFLFLLYGNKVNCIDVYSIGDELYVWAKSGLVVRSEPNPKSGKLSVLIFGDKVTVIEKTNFSIFLDGITRTAIYYGPKNSKSILLKGNWVRVKTKRGNIGYVADQYLLKIKPFPPFEDNKISTKVKEDTLYYDIQADGEHLICKTRTKYDNGLIKISSVYGVASFDEFTIYNISLEEAFVMFNSYFGNYEDGIVEQNWRDEIIIEYEMCKNTLKRTKNKVTVSFSCSC